MLALNDDDSDVPEEGEWLDVGNESTGPTPPKDNKPSAAEGLRGGSVKAEAKAGAVVGVVRAAFTKAPTHAEDNTAMSPIAGAKKEDAVAPFSLDPSFDYDAPVENTTRFSVARVLEKARHTDMQEAVSSSKERTMMNRAGAGGGKKSGCPH